MKKNKIGVAFVITLIVVTLTVTATSGSSTVVYQPWKAQTFADSVNVGVQNLSSTYAGGMQSPMVSWNIGDSIYHGFPDNAYFDGACGPNNAWYCHTISAATGYVLSPGTLSPMATHHFINSFIVGWVYRTTVNYLQGVKYEYSDAGEFLTNNWTTLIDLGKFGGVLVGTPSLQFVQDNYHVALTVRNTGDFPTYKLVYLYRSSAINTSCIDGGSFYQCDVIEESVSPQLIASPSLSLTPDGRVGIAYFKGNEIKFAYPHMDSLLKPSNCGPDEPQTWRCITIKTAGTGTLGREPKFAFGATSSEAGIVYTFDDSFIENTLFHADYVGSGGNCGSDKTSMGMVVWMWNCTEVDLLTYAPAMPSFSIAIDPEGYSVIAYNNALGDVSPISLYIAYPNARVGNINPGWTRQKIDGANSTIFQTGAGASLSLNDSGLGLIFYLQNEDFQLPDLKIAQQQAKIYLPLVVR